MDISKLGSIEMLLDYRAHNTRLVQAMDRISTGKLASDSKDDPLLWGEVEGLKQLATTLTGFSDNLNRAAATVRVAIDSMELGRAHLGQAEQALNQAFEELPGSPERAAALREYNQLLNFVDDAAEAPDAGARRLLDSPANFPDAGAIDIKAGDDGYVITLQSQEIHTGSTGLDLPRAGDPRPSALEADPLAPPVIADIENATNEEIIQMLAFVEVADEALVAKNKALSVDAGGIEDSINFNQAFIQRNNVMSEKINIPDLNAEAAIVKSVEIKSALALNGLSGVNSTYQLSLQLFR